MVACQVRRLSRLVKKFSDLQDETVYFWIDSMCVPLEHPARQQAIKSMFDTYASAFATIVLSADLMDYHINITEYLEPAMRIATSNWMRRLWTFQEGVMSRNLYFLFANGLRNIEDLEAIYPLAEAQSVIAPAARSFYTNLLRPYKAHHESDADLICSIWRGLQWRTSSRQTDEVIAVARIFNIDSPEIHTHDPYDQMVFLLKNLPEIPSGLIFLPGRRLRQQGFRWSPSTWMIGKEPDYPDPLSYSKPSPMPSLYSIIWTQSILTDRGLLVRFPGFCLSKWANVRYGSALPAIEGGPMIFPVEVSLQKWYELHNVDYDSGSEAVDAVGVKKIQDTETKKQDNLAMILCRPEPGVIPEIIVVVNIIENVQDTFFCRWLFGERSIS